MRDKILTNNFFSSKGCKHIFTPVEWTCEHKMVDSVFSLYPWGSCTCPSPGICPGQRFTIFLDCLKGLGDGLGHVTWPAIFARQWDCTRIRKKQEPFKQCKSPKMATWGILSNLRGWHILWKKRSFFLQFSSSFNLNSSLQIHLGAIATYVSVFLIGINYLGRAGVIAWWELSQLTTVLVLGHKELCNILLKLNLWPLQPKRLRLRSSSLSISQTISPLS
jgi:hypothetical protein